MEAIVLALGASLSWGLGDFFGPLQGRKLGALRTLVYVQLAGLAGIAVLVAVRGVGPKSAVALLAIPAAVSGTLGLFAYYRGVAVSDQRRRADRGSLRRGARDRRDRERREPFLVAAGRDGLCAGRGLPRRARARD